MRLVIKGSPKNAKREAARRGIQVRNCRATGAPMRRETVCDAPASAYRKAMDWMGRKETFRYGRGAAPGSLLFFNGPRRRRKKRRR